LIVLYALAEGVHDPAAGSLRVGARSLRAVRCGPLEAIVAEHATAPSRTTGAAQEHAEVVAAIAERFPVVPVRFGSWHADEEALRVAVSDRAEDLLDLVREVGGAVEFLVRPSSVPPVRPTVPVAAGREGVEAPGRGYLEGRLAQAKAQRAAELAAVDRLLTATATLDPLARAHRLRRGRAGVERCFLVAREEAARFAALLEDLTEGTDLLAAGPWPPFTFAAEDPRSAGSRSPDGPRAPDGSQAHP
jgi:hypothetical protein